MTDEGRLLRAVVVIDCQNVHLTTRDTFDYGAGMGFGSLDRSVYDASLDRNNYLRGALTRPSLARWSRATPKWWFRLAGRVLR